MKYVVGVMLLLCGLYAAPVAASVYANQMYCTIQSDSVQITLKKDNTFLCNDYIYAIDRILKRIVDDLLIVQGYINRGEDVWYWTDIREILRSRFLYVDRIKKDIVYSMDLFESNIFVRYKAYLQRSLVAYYDQLIDEQYNWHSERKPDYHQIVSDQITVIEAIWEAENFDTFLPLAQKYILLRKQLAGKLVW